MLSFEEFLNLLSQATPETVEKIGHVLNAADQDQGKGIEENDSK